MSFIRDLIFENPMMVEIQRFRQRTFSTSRGGGGNLAVVILILVFYLIILAVILRAAKDIEPVGLITFQAIVYALLIPVMVSGAIAGERERRTWDILLVAPVSRAQLVAGKTVAALTGVTVFALVLLIPIGVCSVLNKSAEFGVTAASELYCLSFAGLLVSACIYISSRTRTVFAALGTSLAVVFVALVVMPSVWSMAVSQFAGSGDDPMNWYPFSVLIRFIGHGSDTYAQDHWRLTFTTMAAYVLASLVFFAGSVWQVRKMEEIGNSPLPETPRAAAKEAKKSA